jgi:hypothetical protein
MYIGIWTSHQLPHGLINYRYLDTKAKCRHLKKFTCKGKLRQVFIRVYRLEIQSVMLLFSTKLCELLPPSLWFSPSPSPTPSCTCTGTVCNEGDGESQMDNSWCKVPLQVNFFRWRHLLRYIVLLVHELPIDYLSELIWIWHYHDVCPGVLSNISEL